MTLPRRAGYRGNLPSFAAWELQLPYQLSTERCWPGYIAHS